MVLFHIFQYFSSENATDEDFLSSDLEPFDEMSDSTNKSHATGGSIGLSHTEPYHVLHADGVPHSARNSAGEAPQGG